MQYSGCDLMSAGLMSLSIAYSPVDTISSAVCLPCCQDSLLNEVGPTVHQGLQVLFSSVAAQSVSLLYLAPL